MDERSGIRLSRRKFVGGVAGLTAAGAIATGSYKLGQERLRDKISAEKPAPELIESRFREAGLREFVSFYASQQEWQKTYGLTFPCTCESQSFPAILDRVANGDPSGNDTLLEKLRQPWGKEQGTREKKALERVAQTDFEINGTKDTKDSLREFYELFATCFPTLIITAPNKIRVRPGSSGGYYGPKFDSFGQQREVKLEFGSPAETGEESFYVALYHEIMHAFKDDWIPAIPYMSQKEFASSLTTEANLAKNYLDRYFSLPWEAAQRFKHGGPILVHQSAAPSLAVIEDLETAFAGYGYELPEITMQQNTDQLYRYNRIVHAIGNNLLTLRAKDPSDLTDNDRWYLFTYDHGEHSDPKAMKSLINQVIAELDHYFVGPVQKVGGGFPGDELPVMDAQSQLSLANQQIQLGRLPVISSLAPAEYAADPFGAIRKKLLEEPLIVHKEYDESQSSAITRERLNVETAEEFHQEIRNILQSVFPPEVIDEYFRDLTPDYLLEARNLGNLSYESKVVNAPDDQLFTMKLILPQGLIEFYSKYIAKGLMYSRSVTFFVNKDAKIKPVKKPPSGFTSADELPGVLSKFLLSAANTRFVVAHGFGTGGVDGIRSDTILPSKKVDDRTTIERQLTYSLDLDGKLNAIYNQSLRSS
ncbi:MAG: hypothetical protein HY431_02995 [Candidatus Levybacteria bacterium]|nr:hypothetical protein [Candidatus Levybacteria bacterium]